MRFAYTPEQEELRRTARRFLSGQPTWARAAGELGWAGLVVPEEHGGAGLGFVELCAVLEENGRALWSSPLFATSVAATAIVIGGTAEQKRLLLPRIAAGEITATLAVSGEVHCTDLVLRGAKRHVVDGDAAALLIVAAGARMFLVDAASPGVSRKALPTMDETRRLAEVRFDGVRVDPSQVLGDRGLQGRVLDRACVALASEQVGAAEKCLETALEYAKTRVQFGRAIGSFQAIKHKLADMLVDLETARSTCRWAAWVADHAPEELPLAAPAAKVYCSDALMRCAGESIQIHGGVGFTWEHEAHRYFKRARSSEALFGDPTSHREALARRLEL